MPMTEELRQAACSFGQALCKNEAIQLYLRATADLEADLDACELDRRYQSMLAELVARQRSGQQLPQEELNVFYDLKNLAQENALINSRNSALTVARELLVIVGQELSQAMGLDYVRLALSK